MSSPRNGKRRVLRSPKTTTPAPLKTEKKVEPLNRLRTRPDNRSSCLTPRAQQQLSGKPTTASPLRRGTRPGLRSRPTTEYARLFRINPETILRKPRKGPRAREPTQQESPTRHNLASTVPSTESPRREERKSVDHGAPVQESKDQTPPSSSVTDLAPPQARANLGFSRSGQPPPQSKDPTPIESPLRPARSASGISVGKLWDDLNGHHDATTLPISHPEPRIKIEGETT